MRTKKEPTTIAKKGIIHSLMFLSHEANRTGHHNLYEAIQSVVEITSGPEQEMENDRIAIIEFLSRYRKLSPESQRHLLALIETSEKALKQKKTNLPKLIKLPIVTT